MSKFEFKIPLDPSEYDRLTPLFDEADDYEDLDIPRYSLIHSVTRPLDIPGMEIDAKICSGDTGDPIWSEIVLFKNGSEVAHSEVGESLDDTLEIYYNDLTVSVRFTRGEQ